MRGVGRRALLGLCLAPGTGQAAPVEAAVSAGGTSQPFRAADFDTVGVFDGDWLPERRYARLLDTMAASPGAFGGLRFFGVLNAGTREHDFPTASGGTWTDMSQAPDFAATLRILEELVGRGILPFVALTFFPPAVSPHPITPPPDLDRWERLVGAFLGVAAARFGAAELSRWWLEVWNEPNMPQFWRGSFDDYLALYRATARAARASGLRLRLGGPAIAWLPDGSAPVLMERFLAFLAAEPWIPCDFLSFHRKGAWDEGEGQPRIARLVEAAETTAELALRRIPDRCARGLLIVNDEADMRVGFQHPYAPRLTERFPSWLAALAATHAALSARHAPHGLRFVAAADNANQHLVREPFDGRRALASPTTAGRPDDLVKLPVFGFYEMLRLLGDGLCAAGSPSPGLFQLVAADAGQVGAMVTFHPDRPAGAVTLALTLRDIAWPRVNLAVFRIDGRHANAFAAAGGRMPSPPIPPAQAARLRRAAELAPDAPVRRGLAVTAGRITVPLRLDPFATVLVWITPLRADPPSPPRWLEASLADGTAVLRWTPELRPDLLRYELRRLDAARRDGMVRLRGAMWLDPLPGGAAARYAVRSVTASGIASAWSPSPALRPG